MFRRLRMTGLIALGASMLLLTGCGTGTSDNDNVLDDTLAPDVDYIAVNKADSASKINMEITRSENVTRNDARNIAQVYLTHVYLPDVPMLEGVQLTKDFSPHVRVTEVPEFEEGRLVPPVQLFSTQNYICQPGESENENFDQYQYVHVICVRTSM